MVWFNLESLENKPEINGGLLIAEVPLRNNGLHLANVWAGFVRCWEKTGSRRGQGGAAGGRVGGTERRAKGRGLSADLG